MNTKSRSVVEYDEFEMECPFCETIFADIKSRLKKKLMRSKHVDEKHTFHECPECKARLHVVLINQ